jgi:hypothetical protein
MSSCEKAGVDSDETITLSEIGAVLLESFVLLIHELNQTLVHAFFICNFFSAGKNAKGMTAII